jgi:hypothetical protein
MLRALSALLPTLSPYSIRVFIRAFCLGAAFREKKIYILNSIHDEKASENMDVVCA